MHSHLAAFHIYEGACWQMLLMRLSAFEHEVRYFADMITFQNIPSWVVPPIGYEAPKMFFVRAVSRKSESSELRCARLKSAQRNRSD
jgi:hypothetical protein